MAISCVDFVGLATLDFGGRTARTHDPLLIGVRSASAGTKNTQEKTKPALRGPKRYAGDYVEKGMILYRQLGLKYYPGENVGCGRDLTLYALERGRVVVTRETLSPYPKSPLFKPVSEGMVVKKLFYNVVPDPQPNVFKLVSQT